MLSSVLHFVARTLESPLLYKAQGRTSEAEPLYSESLDMKKRLLGEGHPHTTFVRNNLESLQRAMNHKLK